MKKDLIYDYAGFIALKIIGPLVRLFPISLTLFIGKALGSMAYYFDFKHKALAYAHIRKALADKMPPEEIARLAKKFYQDIGQSVIEIFLIPLVNKEYMHKYIEIAGRENIENGFKKGKGVLLLGAHAGSWELSNLISANLAFPFCLFVRHQKYPRLDNLLNLYRAQKGCKIITRQNQTRELIGAMRNNEAIGMTVDQGGKLGTHVKFLGHDASMSTGAIRIALKYDVTLLPGYYARIKGARHRVIIEPPFEVNKNLDIRDNLQELVKIFEKNILKYPQEYLWTYKIWKYGKERDILILSDGKAGHLNQAEAVAEIARKSFAERQIEAKIHLLEVKYKNKFSKNILNLCSLFSNKFTCQGCMLCLKKSLAKDCYDALMRMSPDMVISCGSGAAGVNYLFSKENCARSISILKPSFLGFRKFSLVILPKHDNPPVRKNVVVIEGAVSRVSEKYLQEQAAMLLRDSGIKVKNKGLTLGFLLGGDAKNFHLSQETVSAVCRQIKLAAETLEAEVLVTTSRRTPGNLDKLARKEFQDNARCRLLVIARENNPPGTIGGILGLSDIIVVSPESISMISEAISSKKYVVIFKSGQLSRKHGKFVSNCVSSKYAFLVNPDDLSEQIRNIWQNKPKTNSLNDEARITEAVKKLI